MLFRSCGTNSASVSASGCNLFAKQSINRDVVLFENVCKLFFALLIASHVALSFGALHVVDLVQSLATGILQLELAHAQTLLLLEGLGISTTLQFGVAAKDGRQSAAARAKDSLVPVSLSSAKSSSDKPAATVTRRAAPRATKSSAITRKLAIPGPNRIGFSSAAASTGVWPSV